MSDFHDALAGWYDRCAQRILNSAVLQEVIKASPRVNINDSGPLMTGREADSWHEHQDPYRFLAELVAAGRIHFRGWFKRKKMEELSETVAELERSFVRDFYANPVLASALSEQLDDYHALMRAVYTKLAEGSMRSRLIENSSTVRYLQDRLRRAGVDNDVIAEVVRDLDASFREDIKSSLRVVAAPLEMINARLQKHDLDGVKRYLDELKDIVSESCDW